MKVSGNRSDPRVSFITVLICAVLVPVLVYSLYDLSYIKEVLPPMKIIGLDQTIHIEDKAGLFDEEDSSKIKASFTDFRDKTGITPALYVITNDEWQKDYDSLKNYSEDFYNKTFLDSEHWVIIYSVNSSDPDGEWYWQTVNGFDIYPLLTKYVSARFTEVFEDGLLDENISISDALCTAVDTMSKEAFERGFGPEKRKVVPVKLDYDDHEIFIEDKTGKLSADDTAKIRKAFEEFQAASGFTPALYVTDYDEWVYDYESPTEFTRDFYLSHWKDGKHWLMTYTIDPDDPSRWYWKTWIGGTVSTLSYNATHDVVSNSMNENLKDTNDSFADALVKTMEAMTADISQMKTGTEKPMSSILITYTLFVIFEAAVWGTYLVRRRKTSEAREDDME